jgi:protein-L-isoaspartate(D-aspartate) O-methyltransferase
VSDRGGESTGPARNQIVDLIAAAGLARDPAVLGALRSLPREVFVPRFWVPSPAGRSHQPPGRLRLLSVDGPDRREALGLIYQLDRALAITGGPAAEGPAGPPTSTISAMGLVASMLETMDLSPGDRVLEVGTGSGYNAALLAELVGDPSLVTSVDIDETLILEARDHLAASGHSGVNLICRDAYEGAAEGAPFDRIVATVGCTDLAPAWLDQLAPGGFALIPLEHGGGHPLMKVTATVGGAAGRVVGPSSFVAIQGRQAGRSPWPNRRSAPPGGDRSAEDLSPALGAALASPTGRRQTRSIGVWDLAYYVALEDRRASGLLGLADGEGSIAQIPEDRLEWSGPHGPDLAARLLSLAGAWLDMGRPAAAAYESRFTLLDSSSEGTPLDRAEAWSIDRVDFRQHVRRPR